ncbi:Phosphoprotein phosphatase 2A regulatory subunit [Giardia muris]|uniref:Phosphoprotein phosphatase 2A regulatory subunit n=1 Tax=Giardia muris TaxID=5742 RepID=A0A4Z1SY35_GIAMU|nr:Phosphoprotein phosphatase 2A regulatory subunit [Giardia muris]|eukprot:TNJ26593.1 Phosphoprotein phosphatase 2A regulatory subunit [Giardia muris]
MPPRKLSLSIDTHASLAPSLADQEAVCALLGAEVAQRAGELALTRFAAHLQNYGVAFFSSALFVGDINDPATLVVTDTSTIPPPSPSLRNSAAALNFTTPDSVAGALTMMSPRARQASGASQAFENSGAGTGSVPLTPSLRTSKKTFDVGLRGEGDVTASPLVAPPGSDGGRQSGESGSSVLRDVTSPGSTDVADDECTRERAAIIDRINRRRQDKEPDPHEAEVIDAIVELYPAGITLHTSGKYPCMSAGLELTRKYGRAQPEANDDVRIISDVIFESVLGLPGFLVWSAVPILLAHFANVEKDDRRRQGRGPGAKNFTYMRTNIPTPSQASKEMLEYGPFINEVYSPETGIGERYRLNPVTLRNWFREEMAGRSVHERLFQVLKLPENEYITLEDLERVAWILLRLHPGLSFLAETPQFQTKYAETVAARILFELDAAGRGVLLLSDLSKIHSGNIGTVVVKQGYGMLLEALWLSQFEADINRILKYFSYEHFYVIYCRFWELDGNHDQRISLDEFYRYGGGCLNRLAAQRAFNLLIARRKCNSRFLTTASASGADPGGIDSASGNRVSNTGQTTKGHAHAKQQKRKKGSDQYITYYDFVCFILAEENRDLDSSLQFWFEVCDVDADGLITFGDFEYFYAEQREAVELAGLDAPDPQDIFCQLVDQVKSATAAVYLTDADQGLEDIGYPDRRRDEESAPQGVSLRELKTSKVRGNIFDVMVNSRKLLAFESRDPYLTVWNPTAQEKTPWDRFCKTQYDLFVNNGGGYE